MIAINKRSRTHDRAPSWQAGFLALLPAIRKTAAISFRKLNPELRDELVQEVIANCAAAYARLAARGREDLARPSPLVRFALAQVRGGRKVGSRLRINDCLSHYAQSQKGFRVERLDQFDSVDDEWREILVADRRATPCDLAAARIDFAHWLREMPARVRQIAKFLATGETTKSAARQFAVSPSRISQLRREFKKSWLAFQGEWSDASGVAEC
jgi:hypothetical protein